MKFLSAFLFILSTCYSIGQIWSNPITGTNPSTSNPYTIGQIVDPSVVVSGIRRGAGISAATANDRYSANSWNTAGIDLSAYFEFSLTPNTGCEINFTSFVYTAQTSGTGPSNFDIRSSLDGFTSSIGFPTSTGTTIDLSTASFQNISSSITFRIYGWGASSATGTFSINDFSFNGSVNCGTLGTITAGTISGGPFNVDCSGTSASGTIAYNSSGTIISGNTFTIQLSDASGSFLSPTIIGTVSSFAANGTLNFTIPAGTPTGSGYLIRIVSSNPIITSSSSSPFTITQLGSCTLIPPYISSVIYDGCDGACGTGSEGMSEIIFGNTGSYSLLVNSANIDLNYTTGSYHMIGTVVNNSSTTTALNTAAGCPGLFVDAIGTTLPPNATFLMVSSALCVNALVWSDLCGQGPIYLIYGSAGTTGNTWHNNGNFGNTGGGKNFTTTFITTSGTFTQSYNYTAGLAVDGNYATYVPGVGTPSTQGNFPNCTITPTALSSELIEYTGELVNNQSLLTWKTATERANEQFTIYHSTKGLEWEKIGTVPGNGTTNDLHTYSFTHIHPAIGMNYYKLFSTDYNGQSTNLGIVPIQLIGNFAYYNSSKNQLEFNSTRSIVVISMDGKIVAENNDVSEMKFLSKGIFIVQDIISGEKQRIVIY